MIQDTLEHTSTAYDPPLLLGDLLTAGVAQAPNQEIVYGNSLRLTYRQLRARIGRLAAGLTRLGIKTGDKVAVMDWDSHRYLECFFAIPMLGAVLHTVNTRLPPEHILYTLNHAEDKLILIHRDFLPLLEALYPRLESVKGVILLDDSQSPPTTSLTLTTDYETLLKTGDPAYAFADFSEDTCATLFYTSGTTGLPKGVTFSHRQLVLHTFAARSAISGTGQGLFSPNDVYMPLTPMFHVHAWGCPYLATLLGAKQVYPGRYLPEALLELIQREKVTFFHCVPTLLQLLISHPQCHETDLSRCKAIIGGAALPSSLAKHALDLGIDIFAGYGLSESCPLLTVTQLKPHMLAWDEARQLAVRCQAGCPVPLVKLRVVDKYMQDLPHDGRSPGEIVARAPWLTRSYFKDPEESKNLWRGGWLHTGDIGTLDEEGYLRITDRIKDAIKSGGEWISSLELENLLLTHPAIAEAAVIGVPDPKWGERPLALVVVKPEQNHTVVDEAHLKHFLEEHIHHGTLSRFGIPERILFIEELPKTSVGKPDKKQLRQQYGKPQ